MVAKVKKKEELTLKVKPNPQILEAVNLYVSEFGSWPSTLSTARNEREDRSPLTVKVIAHCHIYGAACNKKCKEVEPKDESP